MPSDDNTNKHDLVAYADDFLKNTVYTEPHFKFSSQGKIQNACSNAPVITLTYAQSLDGKIAGKNGKQIQLSGKESAVMTHR